MDGARIAASDPRVRAILTEPEAYFMAARRRAWPQAGADIHAALDLRARARSRRTRGYRFLGALRRVINPGKDTARAARTRSTTASP